MLRVVTYTIIFKQLSYGKQINLIIQTHSSKNILCYINSQLIKLQKHFRAVQLRKKTAKLLGQVLLHSCVHARKILHVRKTYCHTFKSRQAQTGINLLAPVPEKKQNFILSASKTSNTNSYKIYPTLAFSNLLKHDKLVQDYTSFSHQEHRWCSFTVIKNWVREDCVLCCQAAKTKQKEQLRWGRENRTHCCTAVTLNVKWVSIGKAVTSRAVWLISKVAQNYLNFKPT